MPRRNKFTPRTVTFGDGKSVTFKRPVSKRRAAAAGKPPKTPRRK